jgi:hypothetical protein
VLQQKGGSGKTTLAINLAAAAHLDGDRALVVDMDSQASAFDWSAARRDGSPLDGLAVVRADRAIALPRFAEITRGYDYVFLDGPPRLGDVTQSAAVAADIAVPSSVARSAASSWSTTGAFCVGAVPCVRRIPVMTAEMAGCDGRQLLLQVSETFEALVHGLQEALAAIGGCPAVWRSDNLSAATRQIPGGGRELNRRFAAVLDHYGASSTRIEPGESHQNGIAEKAHHRLKSSIAQALVVRGSHDFASIDAYMGFVGTIRDKLNEGKPTALLAEERPRLRPLPSTRLPEYSPYTAIVRQWSTIHFAKKVYSVPSRLIGCEVEVHQYPDVVQVWYRGKLTETMPRLRGEQYHRIDYRHVIWSLVRKPGAFARYRYREELFPSLVFRRVYDALRDARGERADVEYVRILHLAASTMQARVEEVIERLLVRGERPDFVAVKALAAPEKHVVPQVHIPPPDLGVYDRLLAGGAS